MPQPVRRDGSGHLVRRAREQPAIEMTLGHPRVGLQPSSIFGALADRCDLAAGLRPVCLRVLRYFPEGSGSRQAFWATYLGLVTGTMLVMVLGAPVGLTTGDDGNAMAALGRVLVLYVLIATVAAMLGQGTFLVVFSDFVTILLYALIP